MAIFADIPIDQGSTFLNTIIVAGIDGNVLDLTGYTGRGKIRKSYGSSASTPFTIEFPDPETGKIEISLTAAQTLALKAGRYVYDVEVVKTADASVTRVLEGQLEVFPSVTQTPG